MKYQDNLLQQIQENLSMLKTLLARTENMVNQALDPVQLPVKRKLGRPRLVQETEAPEKTSRFSEETRRLMSINMKKRWADKKRAGTKKAAKKKAAN